MKIQICSERKIAKTTKELLLRVTSASYLATELGQFLSLVAEVLQQISALSRSLVENEELPLELQELPLMQKCAPLVKSFQRGVGS